jgi:hypothetical protein
MPNNPPGQFAFVHMATKPGDPGYISVEEATRHQLAFNAAWEARPEVIAKKLADAEARQRKDLERNARRERPKLIQTTDYPWLKPDWVETPVRPFKRR